MPSFYDFSSFCFILNSFLFNLTEVLRYWGTEVLRYWGTEVFRVSLYILCHWFVKHWIPVYTPMYACMYGCMGVVLMLVKFTLPTWADDKALSRYCSTSVLWFMILELSCGSTFLLSLSQSSSSECANCTPKREAAVKLIINLANSDKISR